MIKRTVSIDFSHKMGKLKPIASLSGGPLFDFDLSLDLSEQYKSAGVRYIRVADGAQYPTGVIDVHEVFPDFALDEGMALSYNFKNADKLVLAAHGIGAGIFLRLGENCVHAAINKFNTPPVSPDKYARVLERIIAHYNNGFAGGYKLGIKYVEISMSSDRMGGFSGSEQDFFELYRVCAGYIKSKMPRIKVGGYCSGGFRSLNHVDTGKEERGYVPYLENFLTYISNKSTSAPLDFLSWQMLADTPEELALHSNYASSYLNHYGFKKTESIISEFNLSVTKRADGRTAREYPAYLAASLITAAKSDIDMLFIADTHPYARYNGLYTLDDSKSFHPYAGYSVISSFGRLSGGSASIVQSGEDYRHELYSLATEGEGCGYVLLATRGYDGTVEINLSGHAFTKYSILGILGGGERGVGFSTEAENIPLGERIVLRAGKHEVYLVSLS